MEKINLEELINKGYSQREIAEELACSQSNVKYWLKKHGIKTNTKQYNIKDRVDKKCPKCETVKPLTEFYKRSNRNDYGGYCKSCSNNYHTQRVKEVKLKMIEYKSNQCNDCGLKHEDSHYSVFEFHHLDPKEKDPNFDRIKYQKWVKIKDELDKCVMLCANCHRLKHAQIEGW